MTSKFKRTPESALIPIIQKHQAEIAPKSRLGSVEVESGYGIADVVFYSLDKKSIKNRASKKVARLKSYEILQTLFLLSLFNSKRISITQLYSKLPYSERFFRSKLLPFLVKNEICSLENENYLKCFWNYTVAIEETVAIEAKISNWKRGLYQAYRYRQYADFSYLALEAKHIQPAWEKLGEFKKANVGLIKVDPVNNSLEILFSPTKESQMSSHILKMYTNEFVLQQNNFID